MSDSCPNCGGIMCHADGHGGRFGLRECDTCGLRLHEDSLNDQRIAEGDSA